MKASFRARRDEAAPPGEMVTAAWIANTLSVHPRTVLRWSRAGSLPAARRIGGVLRWNRAAVEAFIAGRG